MKKCFESPDVHVSFILMVSVCCEHAYDGLACDYSSIKSLIETISNVDSTESALALKIATNNGKRMLWQGEDGGLIIGNSWWVESWSAVEPEEKDRIKGSILRTPWIESCMWCIYFLLQFAVFRNLTKTLCWTNLTSFFSLLKETTTHFVFLDHS